MAKPKKRSARNHTPASTTVTDCSFTVDFRRSDLEVQALMKLAEATEAGFKTLATIAAALQHSAKYDGPMLQITSAPQKD